MSYTRYTSRILIIRMAIFILTLSFFILWGCGDNKENISEDDVSIIINQTDDYSVISDELNDTTTGNSSGRTTIESFNSRDFQPSVDCAEDPVDPDLIGEFNRFVLSLFSLSGSGNCVSSAGSILQTAGLAVQAAEGETKSDFLDAFPILNDENLPYTAQHLLMAEPCEKAMENENPFSIENALWGHDGYLFSEEYLDYCKTYFNTDLFSLPFIDIGSDYAPLINEWLSNATSENIPSIWLSSDSPTLTRMIQASVVFLKENQNISVEDTEFVEGLFERLDGRQFHVPMIRLKGTFNMYEDEIIRAIELNMENSGLALNIFMPKEGHFEEFADHLDSQLEVIQSNSQAQDAEILLPEFTIRAVFSVKDFMKDQNVHHVYNKYNADFSGINDIGYLFLKDYTSKALVRFKDAAVYAADASAQSYEATEDEPADVWDDSDTTSGLVSTITPDFCEKVYVKAGIPDARPFIFTITDKETQTIFYIGRLLDAGGEEAGYWDCIWPDVIYFE